MTITSGAPTNHAQGGRRQQILDDAAELIGWLKDNPGIPVWGFGFEMLTGVRAGGQLEQIAELAGEPVEHRPAGRRVTKQIGLATYVAWERHEGSVRAVISEAADAVAGRPAA